MKNTEISRRGFFLEMTKWTGLALVTPVLLNVISSSASAQERRRGGGGDAGKPAAGGAAELAWPLVQPGKGMAASVNYVEDQKKVTKKELMTERQGVAFKDQHCKSCGFYKAVGDKNGKAVGTCTIFPQQLVVGDGWCSSWNKKA